MEAAGIADAPEVGSTLEVRAFVSLGQLSPEDVEVQVVHGRVDEHDQIAGSSTVSMHHEEAYEGGRHRYVGRSPWTGRDRSATPPASSRTTAWWRPRPSWGWPRCRPRAAGMDAGILR